MASPLTEKGLLADLQRLHWLVPFDPQVDDGADVMEPVLVLPGPSEEAAERVRCVPVETHADEVLGNVRKPGGRLGRVGILDVAPAVGPHQEPPNTFRAVRDV